jgi:hypothetical protein
MDVGFNPVDSRIKINIQIHRDLGEGKDPLDIKWISALRGRLLPRQNIRDKEDFGRIRQEFA